MKTMKAMKGVEAMKAVTKQNQKQTAGKAAKSKAAPKTSLRKGNLDKLGQMSLKDKVKKNSEGHDDEIEAAMVLKDHMSPEEKVRSWNRHNKHLSKVGNEEEKEEFNNSSKKDKGTLTAIWLLRTEAPKFCTVARKASLEKVLKKREKWLSEKEALEKWGETDLNKHVESGRVTYRETTTWGVYEYCDTQVREKTTSAKHANQWVEAQEYQQNEDGEEEWETQMNKDLMSLLNEFTPGKGKSSGKGKNSDKTPGKGKAGKGAGKTRRSKGGDRNTPLEDMPKEDQLPAAVVKLRKSRDILAHTLSNYEEALEKVKKTGCLSKTSMKEKETMQKLLGNTLEKVKQHLVKGEKNKLQVLKNLLTEAVKVVKDAKDEAKELVQITMKTQSKASGK